MTNILSLVNPLSSVTETLLTKISRICTEQGIPFLLLEPRLVKFYFIMYMVKVLAGEPAILVDE